MRRVLPGLLLVLLLPPLLLFGIAATEPGSRWAVQGVSRLVPELSVDSVQGTLLDGLRLSNVYYRDHAGLQASLDVLVLRWRPSALLLGRLHLRAVEAQHLRLTLPQQAEQRPVRLPGHIVMPLALQLDKLSVREVIVVQGHDQWVLEQLALSSRFNRHGLQIDELHLVSTEARLTASGRVAGEYPYPVSMHVDWHFRFPGQPEVAGRGALSGDVERLGIKQHLLQPYKVDITGTLMPELATGRSRFDLTGKWAELPIPVATGTLFSRQGRLSMQGEVDAYEMAFTSHIQHPAVAEPLKLDFTGRGDMEHLQVEQGHVLGMGGEGHFTGRLGWYPTLAWAFELQTSDIDPGRQWPEWPGALSLDLTLQGTQTAEEIRFDMALQRLQGMLRGHTVEGQGGLTLLNQELQIRDLKLRSGDNRIRLDGAVRPRLKLSFDVDTANLQQLAPGLAGSLQGRGSVQGSLDDPALKLSLQGRQLNLAGTVQIDELALEAAIDPVQAKASRWNLQAKMLRYQEVRLDALAISGKGNASQHQFHSSAVTGDVDLAMRAAGSYSGQQWQGAVSFLSMESPLLGRWQLQQASELQASKTELHVAPFCMTQGGALFCGSGERRSDGSLHSAGELVALPLDMLRPWLSEDTRIGGTMSGSFKVEGRPTQLQGAASLQLTPGILRYRSLEGPELLAEHHDGHVSLQYRDDAFHAQFGLGLGDAGRLQGRGSLGTGVAGMRPLQGALDFELSDPGPLAAVLPQLSEWSGPMRVHGRLGGTLQQPSVKVDGDWRDGRVLVPDLGITLSDIQLAVSGDGDRLNLQGRAVSGNGSASLQGEIALNKAAGWPMKLHIDGKQFQVARRTDLELEVSPTMDVTATREGVAVTGQITVPHARIIYADRSGAVVRSSPDEVVVGEPMPPTATSARKTPRTQAQLRLILGEDVRLKAYGLDTRLAGEVDLHQAPEKPVDVIGQLYLIEGRYKAYGQDLSIEQGRLSFAGPVSSADVNVRAVRKFEQVTAGVLLTGPLSEPTAQLFSEPAMDEADVLSYLMTGHSRSDSQEIDATMLAQAAVSLGLDKTSNITAQLAESLGVDELKVASGESGLESSTLAIGKRLNPDLYVRYLYGLFDRGSAIQLRYSLNKNLRLEGEAGNRHSMDLLYEIERD